MSKLLVNGRPRDVTDHGGGHYSVMLQPEDTNLGRVTIAEPPEVHPDHLQTVHEVAADGGDDMARGILQLTKERDEARRALKAQHDQYEHEIEQYKNAAAERERSRVAAQREADTVRESLEMAASDRDRFNAGLTDANGRIAELQAQRLKERLTIVDQARQIAELRTTLEQRASEHAAALSRQASTWESDRREGAEQVRRLIEENQKGDGQDRRAAARAR
jgi:chromosome segregation ATPase